MSFNALQHRAYFDKVSRFALKSFSYFLMREQIKHFTSSIIPSAACDISAHGGFTVHFSQNPKQDQTSI